MRSTTKYPAMTAGNTCPSHAQRTQNPSARMSTQAMCGMWAMASATTGILLIQTGVVASVSLFVLLMIISFILLVVLIGLLSVSGLTKLLLSLVGLLTGLAPHAMTGD